MNITPEKISIDIALNSKKAEKGLKNIENSLKSFGKIGKANNKIFGDFLRLAGFAGLTKMAVDSARFAHSMDVLSHSTGIATDKLAKMTSVWAALTGSRKSFGQFASKMASDLAGVFYGKDSLFFSGFAKMGGIPVFDKNKKVRDIKDLFGDVADYMAMQNTPDWVKEQFLQTTFGVPAELTKYLTQGRGVWEEYIGGIESRIASPTSEDIAKNERLNESLNETIENFKTAIDKTTAKLSDALIPVLNQISGMTKEHPVATVGAGILGGATFGTLLAKLGFAGIKGVWSHPAVVASAGVSAYTLMEALGYRVDMGAFRRGEGIKISKSTKSDLVSDFLNSFKGSNYNPNYSYRFNAKNLMDMYESGVISKQELKELMVSDLFGGPYTVSVLREMTKDRPDVMRVDGGYSWVDFWKSYDTNKAETIKNFSPTFNQENHFTINDMTADDAERFGEIAVSRIYHPLVWKAMTGG